MKSTIEKLSDNEREALAHFYDSAGYKALRHLIEIERLELAKDHVDQIDIMHIRYLSGKSASLKGLISTLKNNFRNKG